MLYSPPPFEPENGVSRDRFNPLSLFISTVRLGGEGPVVDALEPIDININICQDDDKDEDHDGDDDAANTPANTSAGAGAGAAGAGAASAGDDGEGMKEKSDKELEEEFAAWQVGNLLMALGLDPCNTRYLLVLYNLVLCLS